MTTRPHRGLIATMVQEARPELIYRYNAFRILNLRIDASPQQVSRQAKLLRMRLKLGRNAQEDRPTKLPFQLSLEMVRSAVQILHDAERRFVHEIFWVWPAPAADCSASADGGRADQLPLNTGAAVRHNLAVLAATAAVDAEYRNETGAYSEEERRWIWTCWERAVEQWKASCEEEEFWCFLRQRARLLDDPRLAAVTVDELRRVVARGLANVHAIEALRQAELQGIGIARQHGTWVRFFDPASGGQILHETCKPFRERVALLVQSLESETQRGLAESPQAVRAFIADASQAARALDGILGADDVVARSVWNTIADTANRLVVRHWEAFGDHSLAADLLSEIEPLARSERLAAQIRRNAEAIRAHAEESAFDALRDVDERVRLILESDSSATEKFRRLTEDVLPRFQALWKGTAHHEVRRQLSRLVAGALRLVAVELHNDEDEYELALEAIELARRVNSDPEFAKQLERDWELIEDHAYQARLTRGLKPVGAVPSLFTINGFGTALYGRSEHESRTGSYMTTLYLTAFWIPVIPLGRYRVRKCGEKTYQFLGQAQLRLGDKIHLGLLAALVLWMVWVANGVPSSPGTPKTQEVVATSAGDRVSAVARRNAERLRLRNEIDADRARLMLMEEEIRKKAARLDALKAELDMRKKEIDVVESMIESGIDTDIKIYKRMVSEYNDIVEEHNKILAELKTEAARYNAIVDEVNAKIRELRRSGTPGGE